jgi:lipopolysaccharide heptosyltransferase III
VAANRILFVAPNQLGDAVLTTGILAYLIEQHPNARFTIICSPLNAPLFRAAPRVERILAIQKRRYAMHWLDAFAKVVFKPWDMLVDFRNVGIFRLLPAGQSFRATTRDFTIHKVEENARVLGIAAQDPHLWIDDKARTEAAALLPDTRNLVGFGPMSLSPYKEWPPERFAELARRLSQGALPGARFVILAAQSERRRAQKLLDLLPPGEVIDLIGKTDVLGAAACLERLTLYVGNDSGLMHMSAAAGVPTLGLFGTGWPTVYRPWGRRAAYIERRVAETRKDWMHLEYEETAGRAMTEIDVDTVERAAMALLNSEAAGVVAGRP